MLGDILGSFFVPHLFAFLLLFKIATLEVRPEHTDNMREDLALLWSWYRPHWHMMVNHPLYWAATAIATAFFLAGGRIFQ